MSTIAIACCKFQSEVSSRVSCAQMKTPIVFNMSKAWLVTSFIIVFKWANTLQNVFFCQSWASCVQTHHLWCSLGPFLFFCVVEGWTQVPKKTCNISTMNVFFFKWASSLVVFSSFFFFNLGHLLFMVVFCVQACHPCGVPLAPLFCVERRNMSSKEKLKHCISEHHFFSSEQVHQLPLHDYNIFDGCLMFMVILCSSSSSLWCPFAPFFCCGRKRITSKEKLQNCISKNKAQLVALVVIFQMNKFIAHPFVIFFNHMVIFYSWSFCVVCYKDENEIYCATIFIFFKWINSSLALFFLSWSSFIQSFCIHGCLVSYCNIVTMGMKLDSPPS